MKPSLQTNRKYKQVWKILLEKGNLSIRCFERGGFSVHSLIRGMHNEKSLDKENTKRFMLKARVDRKEKDIVHFVLKRRINILEV